MMEKSARSETLLMIPNGEEAVNKLEGRAAIQGDLDRLEKWADKESHEAQ